MTPRSKFSSTERQQVRDLHEVDRGLPPVGEEARPEGPVFCALPEDLGEPFGVSPPCTAFLMRLGSHEESGKLGGLDPNEGFEVTFRQRVQRAQGRPDVGRPGHGRVKVHATTRGPCAPRPGARYPEWPWCGFWTTRRSPCRGAALRLLGSSPHRGSSTGWSGRPGTHPERVLAELVEAHAIDHEGITVHDHHVAD